MAKEYIEREAAYDALSGMDYYTPTDATRAISAVRAIPTADVVPLIHATWETDTCHFYCSECEQYVDYKTNYCPNCGARMDGDGDV